MPFFLATASPSFSALTTCCGLAGATGATNALAPESSSSERNWQRMVTQQSSSSDRSALGLFEPRPFRLGAESYRS